MNKPRVPARNQAMFIKFVAFLKEQGALESFSQKQDIEIFEDDPYDWISGAFMWDRDWNYWNNINQQWRKICQSY